MNGPAPEGGQTPESESIPPESGTAPAPESGTAPAPEGAPSDAATKTASADQPTLATGRPRRIWRPWVNTVLHSRAEVDAAISELAACGLTPHPDDPKNWDILVALGEILHHCQRADPVLEMGAAYYSTLLACLAQCGFTHLHGIDLARTRRVRHGPIVLYPGDLTATDFPDHTFRAIACLSVVEHGVDLRAYLAEALRLLKPGGVLITSTDFWCSPLDTAGKTAYGVPVHVFGPAEIEGFVQLALELGFHVAPAPQLKCEERVVHWAPVDLDYTFVNIVATAPPGSMRQRLTTLAHRVRR